MDAHLIQGSLFVGSVLLFSPCSLRARNMMCYVLLGETMIK